MEIKKVKNGWEYDGIVFKDKKSALGVKKATENDSSLPDALKYDKNEDIDLIYDSEDHRSFAHFVSEFLVKQKGKITILELARRIGVSKQTFFDWMNGKSVPSKRHAQSIIEVMECDKVELLRALETNFAVYQANTIGFELEKLEIRTVIVKIPPQKKKRLKQKKECIG